MEKIIVIDYGSQYNQLIARRIRECGVYSEIHDYKEDIAYLKNSDVKGIILSGGPNSVYDPNAPDIDKDIFTLNKPILGICYGMQLTQKVFGGSISPSLKREYGKSQMNIVKPSPLTKGFDDTSTVWMSHGDHVDALSPSFELLGQTKSAHAMAKHTDLDIYTVQFHPEVTHSTHGKQLIENFVLDICQTHGNWDLSSFIEDTITSIKDTVKDEKVILALSGGVDSSVAATLIHQAIGNQLTCVFVDTGLLRKDEGDQVMALYKEHFNIDVHRVNAKDQFLKNLLGVSDPEQKRKIIGNTFIDIFEAFKKTHKEAQFLAQGTIYPDVIESKSVKGPSQTIKSHHNVGGLPDQLDFTLLEPLKLLFKDEVREVGLKLGIPKHMILRHPFPGPGLGIRILGEITDKKVRILQEADAIFIKELMDQGHYDHVSQSFVVLLPIKSVGVMGDKRTYEYVVALRSADTIDFMTATFSKLPYDFLDDVATKIINEVSGINRVVYDITSKPPGTIEWE